MPGYRAQPSRADKAKAIAGVVGVYVVIVGAALMMPSDSPLRMGEREPTVLIDVTELPEPSPPEEQAGRAEEEEGAAGKKAEPTEIVAPTPRSEVPAEPPVTAAPIAGTGSASTAGAATAGTGPGAGGSGTGRGGGGSGGGGGLPAQWHSGRLENRDYPRAALREGLQGTVYVRFTVLTSGRIDNCRIVRSSGSRLLDDTTCRLLTKRLRFRPARDASGRPIESEIGSHYTWGINFHR